VLSVFILDFSEHVADRLLLAARDEQLNGAAKLEHDLSEQWEERSPFSAVFHVALV
jgi:hypothetical protein